MKIRSGFVSNSSSSSFIVAFKEIPPCRCKLQDLLFGDLGRLDYISDLSTNDAADIIYNDLFKKDGQHDLTADEIAEELTCGYLDENEGAPAYPKVEYNAGNRKVFDDAWEKYHKECKKFALKKAKEFIRKNKGAHIRVVEYSDNDGSTGSALEHSGVFDRIPHIRVSHH